MENNLDSQDLGNFSIQDTMDMGMGSRELLSDLFAPETTTGSPDDIKDTVSYTHLTLPTNREV